MTCTNRTFTAQELSSLASYEKKFQAAWGRVALGSRGEAPPFRTLSRLVPRLSSPRASLLSLLSLLLPFL